MKILYHFRTQGTGAEGVHIAGIAEAFEELGHEVVFASPTGIDPRRSAGKNPFARGNRSILGQLAAKLPTWAFEILEIAYNFWAFLRNALRLAGDHYGLIYERHAFFLCSTAMLSRIFRTTFVVEVNELVGDERVRPLPKLAWLARLADKITFRLADLVVVVSPHLKRRVEALGVRPERVLVLPNAVPAHTNDPLAESHEVRVRMNIEGCLVIGFVGWFVEWHQLDRLIETFAALHPAHPTTRLCLVGDGPMRDELAQLAARLGVDEYVVFAGAVPHEQVPAWIGAMDICVVPASNVFRSPIKLFEYMARARAVVAPRVEPIEAVVHHGDTGLLFDPADANDLRNKLVDLILDPPLRAAIGAAAQNEVLEKHTWHRNAERVLQATTPRFGSR